MASNHRSLRQPPSTNANGDARLEHSDMPAYHHDVQPPGQAALTTAALILGILLLGLQLWLLTVALDLYLGGHGSASIWVLGLISGLVFFGGLVVLRILGRRTQA